MIYIGVDSLNGLLPDSDMVVLLSLGVGTLLALSLICLVLVIYGLKTFYISRLQKNLLKKGGFILQSMLQSNLQQIYSLESKANETELIRQRLQVLKRSQQMILYMFSDLCRVCTLDKEKEEKMKEGFSLGNKLYSILQQEVDSAQKIGRRLKLLPVPETTEWVQYSLWGLQRVIHYVTTHESCWEDGEVTLQAQLDIPRFCSSQLQLKLIFQDFGPPVSVRRETLKKWIRSSALLVEDDDYSVYMVNILAAKVLVHRLGGTLRMKNRKGGVQTLITLPMELEPENPVQKEKIPAKVRKEESTLNMQAEKAAFAWEILRGKHILLCEDHPLTAELLARQLNKVNCVVELASTGQEGLDKFLASKPGFFDAVLMDLRMPVLNGTQACQALRQAPRPDAAGIPVIAMTSEAFEQDLQKAKQAGMNHYLIKPIAPEMLYCTLERCFLDAMQTADANEKSNDKNFNNLELQ